MRVLIACEYSGRVRDAFRALGHHAMSADLLPTERPGPHHTGDVLPLLGDGWDLLIGFPPCTHLAVSGARWWPEKRADGRQAAAVEFFMALANAPIPHIALENPVGLMSTRWRAPDQIIQPWQFGHEATKATCLWLKRLPALQPTGIVSKGEFVEYESGRRMARWYAESWSSPDRAKLRSLTYQGVADAMASQWSAWLTAETGKRAPVYSPQSLF